MLQELKTLIEDDSNDIDWGWTIGWDDSVSLTVAIDKKYFTITFEIAVDNISSEEGILIEREITHGKGNAEIKEALEKVATKIVPTLRKVLE